MSPRIIKLASKTALGSKHKQHKMAAILLRGGAVLAAEANSSAGRSHAESRVLSRHADYRGCHLIVFRLNGNQCSRPCFRCIPKIKASGVARVSFIDADGQWVTVSASSL